MANTDTTASLHTTPAPEEKGEQEQTTAATTTTTTSTTTSDMLAPTSTPIKAPLHLANRASESRSPYVSSHENDLVAWQIWDDAMIELAKKSGRVVFVSIGYSGCHWCHVMARESFSNPVIANLLNTHFIPVKVDREERPDLDRIYNTYVQATTHRGGWPLNVFLTPEGLRPLFGGTYFPPGGTSFTTRNRYGAGPGQTSHPAATGGATGGGTGNAAAGVGSVTMKPTHLSSSGPNASVGLAAFGFEAVLNKMIHVWDTQQARCLKEADTIVSQLRDFAHEGLVSREGLDAADEGDILELELLETARAHLSRKFDPEFGGFGLSGKFLVPAKLRFLLALDGMGREIVRDVVGEDDVKRAREMAVTTMKNMWKGGIKDQIGHGFARHSVLRDWSVPNFEKMLYDQAQLLNVYMDAYIVTKDVDFLDASKDLVKYLTSPPICSLDGGFFASENSDSLPASQPIVATAPSPAIVGAEKPTTHTSPIAIPNAAINSAQSLTSSSSIVGQPPSLSPDVPREGAYYVWTNKELQSVLGSTVAPLVARYYSCSSMGNVPPEFDPLDELFNQNVLSVSTSPADSLTSLAREAGLSGPEEVKRVLMKARKKLRAHRESSRPKPTLDDKVILSWNGLALGALARASIVLRSVGDTSEDKTEEDAPFESNKAAADAAATASQKAVEFIKKEMYNAETGRLTRIWRRGQLVSKDLAFADDYAFLISGLLDVYEATGKSSILEWVEALQKKQIELFWDTTNDGFFVTEANQPDVIVRLKDGMDTAEPSTNGVSARNLFRLSSLLNDPTYAKQARKTLHAFEAEVLEMPYVYLGLMEVVVAEQLGVRSVVISGSTSDAELESEIKKLWTGGMNVCRTVVRIGEGVDDEYLKKRNEELNKVEKRGIWVIEDGVKKDIWSG